MNKNNNSVSNIVIGIEKSLKGYHESGLLEISDSEANRLFAKLYTLKVQLLDTYEILYGSEGLNNLEADE
jgi:hypothetical protein